MEATTLTAEQIAQNWVKWLDALISGEYKKGVNTLHTHDGRHCCLGVAQICLGLPITHHGTDIELVPLLALKTSSGDLDGEQSITGENDDRQEEYDFVNMHAFLLENIERITSRVPEVAPLVRKMLAERGHSE
jgi:hypothetical protein